MANEKVLTKTENEVIIVRRKYMHALRRQARENICEQGAIGFNFASHWLTRVKLTNQ